MTAKTCAEAVKEAMVALGGQAEIKEVENWINHHYPKQWKDISGTMADLAFPGADSSTYHQNERFLVRVSRGVYRLRD